MAARSICCRYVNCGIAAWRCGFHAHARLYFHKFIELPIAARRLVYLFNHCRLLKKKEAASEPRYATNYVTSPMKTNMSLPVSRTLGIAYVQIALFQTFLPRLKNS